MDRGPVHVNQFPSGSVAFDIDAFQALIYAHGVQLVHYRAMRSPGGLIDKYDSRRPNEDHLGSSNGFLYTKGGNFTGLFMGNNKDSRNTEQGLLDSANAQMTSSLTYDCGKAIYLAPFDRIYLSEPSVLVTHWQLVEHHVTCQDRLRFPVAEVVDLVDSDGRSFGSDSYTLQNGQIVWCPQKSPGIDPETGKGRIYAIRYLYRPYWYVERMIHEIRVAQQQNVLTGDRTTGRMPQQVSLQREYVFENEDKDENAPNPNSPRQVPSPEDGSFGQR